jgi:hypothetical protein
MDAVLPLPGDFIKPNLGRSEGFPNFLLAEAPATVYQFQSGASRKQQVHGAQGAMTEQTEKTEKTGQTEPEAHHAEFCF